MAGFSIMADVSNTVLGLLRENLCPDPIQSPESIILVSPGDKNSDFQLGVFLYEMKELSEYRTSAVLNGADDLRRYPPKPLTLQYMLFMNNKAQIAAGAEIEQRAFGKAMVTLMDYSTLSLSQANPFLEADEQEVHISLLSQSFEDKTKVWSALSVPYQVAVYFTVSPVLLTPQRTTKLTRVSAARFETGLADRPGGSVKEGGSA